MGPEPFYSSVTFFLSFIKGSTYDECVITYILHSFLTKFWTVFFENIEFPGKLWGVALPIRQGINDFVFS